MNVCKKKRKTLNFLGSFISHCMLGNFNRPGEYIAAFKNVLIFYYILNVEDGCSLLIQLVDSLWICYGNVSKREWFRQALLKA